jgi:hypothetical protein
MRVLTGFMWLRTASSDMNIIPVCRQVRIPPPCPCELQNVTKREPGAWEYNWATLSPGDINIEAWYSRLGVGHKADNLAL